MQNNVIVLGILGLIILVGICWLFGDNSKTNNLIKRKRKYHLLISAQCSPYQDWQVASLWWSIKKRWSDVKATRLLACNSKERKKYRYKKIMPTMYTPNWQYHPKTGELYQPYNRPIAIVEYFRRRKSNNHKAPWIIVMDPDMLIRKPMNDLPVERGKPIAQEASFLNEGIKKIAPKWSKNPKLVQAIGVPYIIHWKDLKKIAPLWLDFTERLRQDEEAKKVVGWTAEMYGYALASAELGITHTIRNDLGDRPPYIYAKNPYLLHFDLEHKTDKFKWNKRDYLSKDMMACNELMDVPKDPPNDKFKDVFYCINEALKDVRQNLNKT